MRNDVLTNLDEETETQMALPHLIVLLHGEDNSAGDNERSNSKRDGDNSTEWTEMGS